jgi:hypothetical protein
MLGCGNLMSTGEKLSRDFAAYDRKFDINAVRDALECNFDLI